MSWIGKNAWKQHGVKGSGIYIFCNWGAYSRFWSYCWTLFQATKAFFFGKHLSINSTCTFADVEANEGNISKSINSPTKHPLKHHFWKFINLIYHHLKPPFKKGDVWWFNPPSNFGGYSFHFLKSRFSPRLPTNANASFSASATRGPTDPTESQFHLAKDLWKAQQTLKIPIGIKVVIFSDDEQRVSNHRNELSFGEPGSLGETFFLQDSNRGITLIFILPSLKLT